jgi:hypothetical protein
MHNVTNVLGGPKSRELKDFTGWSRSGARTWPATAERLGRFPNSPYYHLRVTLKDSYAEDGPLHHMPSTCPYDCPWPKMACSVPRYLQPAGGLPRLNGGRQPLTLLLHSHRFRYCRGKRKYVSNRLRLAWDVGFAPCGPLAEIPSQCNPRSRQPPLLT